MKKFRDESQLEENAFEQNTHDRMIRDVFGWLSIEDRQEERLHKISDARQSGTCNWVLEDPQVRPWIEDDGGDAVLWMSGIPGAGKSFLSSLIIQNLQIQPNRSTLYYFCSHQFSSEDTCANILRTLAVQLLQQNMDMVLLVHQAFLQKGSNHSSPVMRKLLAQVLLTTKVTRIVVDGVDELDRAIQLDILKSLIEIQKSAKDNCKLLICSREEPLIQKSLPAKTHMKLGDKTSEGLGLYIKTQVEDLQAAFPEMDSALVRLVEHRLHSKAKGMFLWVRLVTTTLIDQMSEVQIELAVDQLPEGLDEAYGLIKTRIDALPTHIRERIFKILYWICAARRPIGLHEVADGIALYPGQINLNRKTRTNNPKRDIIDLCAPLLESSGKDVLDLVHFSAKEFFLDGQSGPFIDIAKAHLSIALSSVINLTTCLDVVPGYDGGMSEEDLESRVVQGRYGLQSYGHEFWAEHVLAFLGAIGDPNTAPKQLICALEVFSRVWKHHPKTGGRHPSGPDAVGAPIGLHRLRHSPTLYQFVSCWIGFKAKLKEARRSFNVLDDQQQWQLEKDETYLSLIDARLNTIKERLLTLNSSQLPVHINESEYNHFRSRFSFPCRFLGCYHYYGSIGDRDSHEASHVRSFPCLQCDFSGRGFRTCKDLEKHTQKYHMSPEDFEIPNDLFAIRGESWKGYEINAGSYGASFSRSRAWTEQGRKALHQGFSHVLAKFESEMTAGDSEEQVSMKLTSREPDDPRAGDGSKEGSSVRDLNYIRDKIEGQRYETLADFKNDLRGISRGSMTSLKWAGDENVDSSCEQELTKVLSAFPAFANFDCTELKTGAIEELPRNSSNLLDGHIGSFDQVEKDIANLDILPFRGRTPYWSLTEEKEFPELLQQYGRDFSKIADHLKTKTADEVDLHFVCLLNEGRTELLDLANLGDARLQQEACTKDSSMEPRLDVTEMPVSNDHVKDTSEGISQLDQPSGMRPPNYPSVLPSNVRQYFSQFPDPSYNEDLQPRTQDTVRTQMGAEAEEVINERQIKKRRPRPRAFCPYCTKNEGGLRDEYALEKHILRIHTATRKVWICEDISMDKSFLARCENCSASKRYSSRHNAGKHLRDVHFNPETPAETLQRWMRVIEEPNPNMQAPGADTVSTTKQTIKRKERENRPTSQLTTKRQKIEATAISLAPVKDHPNSLRTLPSMVAQPDGLRASKPASSPRSPSSLATKLVEDDIRNSSPASPGTDLVEDEVVLPDVSFDNLLPRYSTEPLSVDESGPPHRINRALIKPNQVSKLPNLNSFRKSACLDQVEALYHKLDNNSVGDHDYKEALDSLTSLSRSLMRNLRDWRRDSTLAMDIPFSI